MLPLKLLVPVLASNSIVVLLLLPIMSQAAAPVPEKEKNSVVHFVTQDFPPFSYMQEGIAKGFAVDLVQHACVSLNWQCQIHFRPWARALNELREGQYDAAFLLGKNKSREPWLLFSRPIVTTEYGFYVHRSNPLIYQKASDIQGYQIATYGPSNTSHALQKLSDSTGGLSITIRPDDIAGFRQLNAGWVDAVYSNRAVGQAMIQRLNLTEIRYAGADKALNYYVAFPKHFTDPARVEQFNAGIEQRIINGEYDQLIESYRLTH